MALKGYILCGGAIVLSACASLPNPPLDKAKEAANMKEVGESLSARTLARDECGLFVWTAGAKRRFILFSQADKKTGLWAKNGEIPLALIRAEGLSAHMQYPVSTFETPSGQVLALALAEAQVITHGTRFKSGTLTYTTQEGWDKIVPVVGLAACQI